MVTQIISSIVIFGCFFYLVRKVGKRDYKKIRLENYWGWFDEVAMGVLALTFSYWMVSFLNIWG